MLLQVAFREFGTMPRTNKRKTTRAAYSSTDIVAAVKTVTDEGLPIRKVARDTGIDRMTLTRYIKKYNTRPSHGDGSTTQLGPVGYWGNRRIFTADEEILLTEYLRESCRMYFGLTSEEVRKLAYEFAWRNKKEMPENWLEKGAAGIDWFQGFMKRHEDISLRQPESTSIARASSFNEANVSRFFDLLEEVKSRYSFQAKDIFNIDETGCMTVQKSGKVVAPTGAKQVGAIASAERGQTVTLCCAVNAAGQSLAPMFIFPRVYFKEHFIRDGPAGCIGTAHPSGWMTGDGFLHFMHHFANQVSRPTVFVAINHCRLRMFWSIRLLHCGRREKVSVLRCRCFDFNLENAIWHVMYMLC